MRTQSPSEVCIEIHNLLMFLAKLFSVGVNFYYVFLCQVTEENLQYSSSQQSPRISRYNEIFNIEILIQNILHVTK